MKTEAIRTCIQFRQEYETDSGIHLAQRASAELAALKEENEKLRELLGEWRKSLQDVDVRVQTRNIAADISFASLVEKTDAALS